MTDHNATPGDRSGLRLVSFPKPTDEEINQAELAAIAAARNWVERTRMDVTRLAFWQRLHEEMFDEIWTWAGHWRRVEKNIGVKPYQITVQLQQLQDDLAYWVSRECDMQRLEGLARFHHRAVWIHPFENGNGRWSRLATDALAVRHHGLKFLNWADPDEDLRNPDSPGRQRYVAAIKAGDQGDMAPLIEYLRGLNKEIGV